MYEMVFKSCVGAGKVKGDSSPLQVGGVFSPQSYKMEEKQEIRQAIWKKMEDEDIASFPRPVFGRIPNFKGSEKTARRIRELADYKEARNILITPDSPQRKIRELALKDGKIVLMPTPKIKEGFLILDPKKIPRDKAAEAATIKGASKFGDKGLIKVDLIVTGSVAVDLQGGRVGKGSGYADQEYAILKEHDLINETTKIITNVHDCQIVEKIPMEKHDIRADYIVTPERVITI
jgi:5-formyltetrahydrofolate cyclo-ligase